MSASATSGSSSQTSSSGKRPELESASSRRKSFLPATTPVSGHLEGAIWSVEDKSPGGEEGWEGDDVLRRGGRSATTKGGLGGDILKEMRVRQEMKRASFVPKTEHSMDKDKEREKEGKDEGKPFANMFLR